MKRRNNALVLIEQTLRRNLRTGGRGSRWYRVPSLWRFPRGTPHEESVNPWRYYHEAVRRIRRERLPRRTAPTGGEWTKEAVVYNMFVRTTAAYDHDGDGRIEPHAAGRGFRETGTFLKALAMLPYVRALGANTVHLLPVTSIGHDGNKGSLGSPYAIRNPYMLDENLAEPALGLGVETEFKAFVEAAHRLGLRVVVEFVFRTASKDGDWIREHPEWFYWIREDVGIRQPGSKDETLYGSPVFTTAELAQIHENVRTERFDDLTPPHNVHRLFFTEPPPAGSITSEDGRLIGRLHDGTRVKIPGAFADWPPDDNQPPWGDVTYLRMYTHPDFNYIAYNTIRMYDRSLARPENVTRPLWDRIVGIIPHYQKSYRIDGVMIDMGHALPMELKAEMVRLAREYDPDFAFWDENFEVTRRSREEGYNAVVGYCWIDQHHPEKFRKLCQDHAVAAFPIPYFATPETHNTPRASARSGGEAYARWAGVTTAFLPAVAFVHSGYELAETYPINTGLDFTREELRDLPSENLPLFSQYGYMWTRPAAFPGLVSRMLAIRRRYRELVTDHDPSTITLLEDTNPHILAYARVGPRVRLAVAGSLNFEAGEQLALSIESSRKHVTDLLTGELLEVCDGRVHATLRPGQCVVFVY